MNRLVYFTVNQLINYNTYIGGWKRSCHRSFNQFVLGWRMRFSILNVEYLFILLRYSINIFKSILLKNGNILLACRHLPFNKKHYSFLNLHIINTPWKSGLLTNYKSAQSRKTFVYPSFVVSLNNKDRNNVITKECAKANIWCSTLSDVSTDLYNYNGLPLISNNIMRRPAYFFFKLYIQHYLFYLNYRKLNFFKKFFYYRKK